MSLRELKSLTTEGAVVSTRSRLRSGKNSEGESIVMSESNTQADSAEGAGVLELRQQLAATAEELETVRNELSSQLHQARQMAEEAKEESEEQKQQVLQLSHELEQNSSQLSELKALQEQEKEQWAKEMDMLKMNLELERLRQLEEVRCRGDRERERFQQEQEKAEALLARLRKELADERQKNARYVGNMHESSSESEQSSLEEESITYHSTESNALSRRRVTFTDTARDAGNGEDSSGGNLGPANGDLVESAPTGQTPVASLVPIVSPSTYPPQTGVSGSGGINSQTTGGPHDGCERGSSHGGSAAEGSNTNSDAGLMQQLTQLVQTQTAMVMA